MCDRGLRCLNATDNIAMFLADEIDLISIYFISDLCYDCLTYIMSFSFILCCTIE